MNPRNYREWSADVNLISDHLSCAIAEWPEVRDAAIWSAEDLFCALFDCTSICLIANNFCRNHHGLLAPEFAVLKPRFWRQKYENQDQHAQYIPLPRRARVVPKDNLSDCVRQAHKSLEAARNLAEPVAVVESKHSSAGNLHQIRGYQTLLQQILSRRDTNWRRCDRRAFG